MLSFLFNLWWARDAPPIIEAEDEESYQDEILPQSRQSGVGVEVEVEYEVQVVGREIHQQKDLQSHSIRKLYLDQEYSRVQLLFLQ